MVDEHVKLVPIANVGRIMKQILPPTAKISKEAKETMQECASEFISFVTGEASDKCHKENRRTVNGDDICWALSSLGFDNYAEVMLRYLYKLRDFERVRANQNKLGLNDDDNTDDDDDDGEARRASTTSLAPLEINVMERVQRRRFN
ncbi:nuclear transcription factor Y subunit B-4-like [Solanum lycopersicum]|uniref:nuclear transcription factor Y subunit B-4-like n=1 Tax=Solanum lycopersicum TaxID=4081 RepID=UPI0002768D67|nr:nuclear transcription factor Y subunit B-4-like [Solanum lycopersicum]